MNSAFRPNLIQPRNARVGLRILDKKSNRFAQLIMGNETVAAIGLSAGDRVIFGTSNDRRAGAVTRNENGWKLIAYGEQGVSVQIKAEKLGLEGIEPQPPAPLNFIRYDSTLVIDLNPIHRD